MLVYLLFVFVANLYTRLACCQDVCRTEDCVKVSQWILNNLNTSVDPCVDMYEFACGGWMQNNSIPEGYEKWSVFRKVGDSTIVKQIEVLEADGWVFRGRHSSAVKKMKQFYKSCKDIKAIERKGAEPLIKLIDEHGSWTVTNTNKSWNRNNWTIQEALQNSHKLMGRSLWGINIYKDLKNASRNMMNFYQAAVTLEGEEYDYNRTSVRNQFMDLAMKVGRLLGGQNDTVYDKMSEVFNFEISLSEVCFSICAIPLLNVNSLSWKFSPIARSNDNRN
ncbi:Endothelin-converting enzyme 2 [Bulinus truncatus]|nr:Endothelin-converting enzyme 2 [Bulinus truncatus]